MIRIDSAPAPALAPASAPQAPPQRQHFERAILDITLPGKSGLTLMQEMRGKGNACEVALFAAFAGLDTAIEGRAGGAAPVQSARVSTLHAGELRQPVASICCAMMKDRIPNQVHGPNTFGALRAFAVPALAHLAGVVGTWRPNDRCDPAAKWHRCSPFEGDRHGPMA